jgi:hypothetical protein
MAVRTDTSLAKAKAGGHTPGGTAKLGLRRVGEAQGACGPWVEFGLHGRWIMWVRRSFHKEEDGGVRRERQTNEGELSTMSIV